MVFWGVLLGLPGVSGLTNLAGYAGSAHATITVPSLRATGQTPVTFGGGTFADTTFEDVDYVSAEFLGALFAAPLRWDPAAQQVSVKDPANRVWAFTLDNPFFSVQGATYNLTYPVRRGPERIYIPWHPLLRVMRTRYDLDVDPSLPGNRAKRITPPVAIPAPLPEPVSPSPGAEVGPPGRIVSMTLEERDEETSVLILKVAPGAQWQGVFSRPHFIVRAFGGTLGPDVPRRLTSPTGPLQSADVLQQGNTTQFTLRMRGAQDSASLAPLEDGSGWAITMRRPAPKDSGSGRGTVIVDAGHGGKDPGAVVKGVREADVNLAVAKLLRTELEQRGYKVLLTRDSDVFKTLQERPKFASDNKGDLFISLHCNSIAGTASRLANVTGYVGYILREAESEEDKAIARRENQAIEEQQGGKGKRTEISPLDWILLEHQLNLYSKQSESLTESIVRNFSGFDIPKYTTGARQAGFFVLVGAYMPAVLFEMGFLTNDNDRRVLGSSSGQREMARRLALAIDEFQRKR